MVEAIYQVNSFTDKPFGGNPAGVCILKGPAAAGWMQNLASQINAAETAFLYPEGDSYQLRWFTPVTEVPLCGHATLASAHILWETGRLTQDRRAVFCTRSGELTADRDGKLIAMDFPAVPTVDGDEPDGLIKALGVQAAYIGAGTQHHLVLADTADQVLTARPDFSALVRVTDKPVILTARSESPEFDIVSRFFAPSIGVNEDPVTGFAHCCLGPFWKHVLEKRQLRARQASARGGDLMLDVGDERVKLIGQAVTAFQFVFAPIIDRELKTEEWPKWEALRTGGAKIN